MRRKNPVRVTREQADATPFIDYAGDLNDATWTALKPSFDSMLCPDARDDLAWASHLPVGDAHRLKLMTRGFQRERSFRQHITTAPAIVYH